MLPLHILTIVYNGMPFLPMQLACFNRLRCDWTWHIVEGPAAPVNCTSWCKPQEPGFSTDGSHEFILSLKHHPRCDTIWQRYWRGGKVEMCNHGIASIPHPCLLLQVDVDELWLPDQIDRIVELLSPPGVNASALFMCRYFVGPNIITVGHNCYGNNPGEWSRVWRFEPGTVFLKHEPPILSKQQPGVIPRDLTASIDLAFDHFAYVFESQVAYKEAFYGYKDGVKHWRRLQDHKGPWPVKLKDFLPWVDDRAQADLLHK